MNLNRIKKIAEEKRITIKSIAEDIGMTSANFHKCIRDNRIEAGALEKITQVLEVPVSYFFDDAVLAPVPASQKANSSCQGCIDKQEIIQLLKDKIDYLEDKIDYLEDKLEAYEGKHAKRAAG